MDTTEYLTFAKSLAHQAGGIMLQHFTYDIAVKLKEDGSRLTVADTAVNQLVVDTIRKKYPEHNILSEEGGYRDQSDDCVWICDPIDGTIPYSHGIPTSMFLLALCVKSELQVAVAYDPYQKRLFTAEKGKGAYLNEVKISATKKAENKFIGICYWDGAPVDMFPFMKLAFSHGYGFINVQSYAYMATLAAAGIFAGALMPGKFAHDYAAPGLIMREAGGVFTDLRGDVTDPREEYYGAIMANSEHHAKILELLRQSGVK